MRTINVKNERELYEALSNPQDNDTIMINPGEYFSPENTPFLMIKKSLTIIGQSSDANDTILNCGLVLAEDTIVNLENLSMRYASEQGNTLALYDGAELNGDNVIINRDSPIWNTIYCKDSTISLKDSQVLSGNRGVLACLEVENGQLSVTNSKIKAPVLTNSTAYFKDVLVTDMIILKEQSKLDYDNLTVDGTANEEYSTISIEDNSSVSGQDLGFIPNDPYIEIDHSNFQNDNFKTEFTKINWKFDNDSIVLADGNTPQASDM